ncbi:phage tail-collar fiber domain-containing protein [Proteus sp. G2615]|uniref:phage tail-collar fiber domain-containing protein n=1 Tax=Proteus sp. G2615 TaxID=2698845 RepID=UPI001378B37D|nr:phage tail protein [Proteus sp. G2615]NBN73391.1 hypothetical protein [Proteus sp. G2615]
MSQSAITLAFERWKASATEAQQPVVLDEFVLANIPNLDPSKPIDRNEGLPDAKYIMHRQAVNKTGVVNQNAVAYSVTIGAEIGDFDFNWIGLLNKKSGTVAMIVHAPTQRKIKTQAGQQGNVLTRSFLLEYLGASKETAITTPAEMWQIDFTARLSGIDEMQRLINRDKYGVASFFSNGFLVAKAGNQFYVTKGLGYIEGLRTELPENKNITVPNQATKVWVDVSYQGNITSDWDVHIAITVKPDLKNYTDNAHFPHFVFAVASISATGVITDLRPKGTLDAQYFDDALKKHEQSRNHPDATISAKGFTRLDNQVSSSQTTSLTPFGAQKALENYQPKGNYQPSGDYVTTTTFNLEVNKKFDKASVSQYSGNSKELVMSQAVVTSLISERPKKEYVDTELDKRQLKGNYADKSDPSLQRFSGPVVCHADVGSEAKDGSSKLQLLSYVSSEPFIRKTINGISDNYYLPVGGGTLALESYGYSKKAADDKYSPKLPLLSFSGEESKIVSPNNKMLIFVNDNGTSGGYDRDANATVWGFDKRGFMTRGTVHFDRMSGVYSQSQIDTKLNGYQLKGNYLDKSSTLAQHISGALISSGGGIYSRNGTTEQIGIYVKDEQHTIACVDKNGVWYSLFLPKRKNEYLATLQDIENANIYPWGVLIPWCGATAPDWALVANGSAFNKTTYSKLGQYFPSGRLPDARANVLRGLDAGRGVDAGRTILSEQMGNSLLSTAIIGDPESKGFEVKIKDVGTSGTNNQGWHWLYQQTEGKNGNETRMRNTSVLWIVRAK